MAKKNKKPNFRKMAKAVVGGGLGYPGVPEIADGLLDAWNEAVDACANAAPDRADQILPLKVAPEIEE